jgi:hypothetical protein
MIEIFDTTPHTDVQPAEYARLLGYPRGWRLEDRALELSNASRDWYQRYGRPAVYVRQTEALSLGSASIDIDGMTFSSSRLLRTLRDAGAHAVMLVAVTAGAEIAARARELWEAGKPDEYFFLEIYGSALVEHLITMTGAQLCDRAEREGMAILPHDSPGYPEWPIDEQGRLLDLVKRTVGREEQRHFLSIDVLESGMLRPKKSLLAVFGLTSHVDRVRSLRDLIPCETCSFLPCQYRRAPYLRLDPPPAGEHPGRGNGTPAADRRERYRVNAKALKRWTRERLSLDHRSDGTIDATFRYEGTTCTNSGRPLEFRYRVTLGPREDGYPIREERCDPADGDDGFTYMCRYLTNADDLMGAIGEEKPLLGRQLDDVLGWSRPDCAAGCYCQPEARLHKWGLVLETIHYALQHEHE